MGEGEGGEEEDITEEDQYTQSFRKLNNSTEKETLQPSPETFDPNVEFGVKLLKILTFNGIFLLHMVI